MSEKNKELYGFKDITKGKRKPKIGLTKAITIYVFVMTLVGTGWSIWQLIKLFI